MVDYCGGVVRVVSLINSYLACSIFYHAFKHSSMTTLLQLDVCDV